MTDYKYDGVDLTLLARFPNPFIGAAFTEGAAFTGTVNIRAPEFTSLCPLTGQPDFAVIVIE